jgi:hypothetical protein
MSLCWLKSFPYLTLLYLTLLYLTCLLFICLCEDDGIDGVGVHKIGDSGYWSVLVD